MDAKIFGNRLRELRKEHGATQKMVADYIGVDVTTLAHYEAGRRSPNPEKMSKLAEYYNLNDEILGVGTAQEKKNEDDNKSDSDYNTVKISKELELTLGYVEALCRNTGMSIDKSMRTLEIPAAQRRRLKAYLEAIEEVHRLHKNENK